jgi:hypothetical protein
MTNRAPLFTAIALLLLPVLYVGSYLALAVPKVRYACRGPEIVFVEYRMGGDFAVKFFSRWSRSTARFGRGRGTRFQFATVARPYPSRPKEHIVLVLIRPALC